MGSAASVLMANGPNLPPTIEIRPGHEFNMMVTEDLAFPGPYKG